MHTSLKRALVLTVVCSSPAFAQGGPATPTASSAAATTEGQFSVGPFYAGPRIWIGNLNGAMAIGGQIEKGFTQPGKYGPGIISGGVGVECRDFFGHYYRMLGRRGPVVMPTAAALALATAAERVNRLRGAADETNPTAVATSAGRARTPWRRRGRCSTTTPGSTWPRACGARRRGCATSASSESARRPRGPVLR